MADQKALEESKEELVARTKEMLATKEQLQGATRTLDRRRSAKASLLAEIQERHGMAETLVFELEEARGRLGELMAQLVAGEEPDTGPVLLPMRLFRGGLGWPVSGDIESRFGKHLHPRFHTVTVQNGLEIEAPLHEPVRAVYDGQVLFASWFQGYGRLLIIGHPNRVHSLYGHLSDISVAKGDVVERGQVVAQVGDTGSLSGPRLYFEIREDGLPVDPEQWLAVPEQRASLPETEENR
jgi:septal ring factor EnvC (AmiA/AmiB activator)